MMLIGLCMLLVLTFDSVRTKLPYPFLLDAFPLEKKFLGKFRYFYGLPLSPVLYIFFQHSVTTKPFSLKLCNFSVWIQR